MESLLENCDNVIQKRRKKGEGSVQAERKQRRSEGKAYVNSKNILVKAKEEPKAEVSCKCKFHCKDLPHEQKLKLFNDFYGMKDTVRQNSFLMELLTICAVKRRRNGKYVSPEYSKRQATISFTLPNETGDSVHVCKSTFMEVLGISKRRIQTLVKAKKMGETFYTEKRGNKIKNRKFSVDDEALVIQQINSLPKQKSHYSRLKNDKEYLSKDLNISKLYSAFKRTHPESEISYRYYYALFKRKFPKLTFTKK